MENYTITKKEFGLRLAKARETRGISARQMSLDIGQNKNYINSIETGRNYPSMNNYFDICNYLNIPPTHLLYADESATFHERFEILELASGLSESCYQHILKVIRDMSEMQEHAEQSKK